MELYDHNKKNKGINTIRESNLFDVVIEFYVKKIELKFSYN